MQFRLEHENCQFTLVLSEATGYTAPETWEILEPEDISDITEGVALPYSVFITAMNSEVESTHYLPLVVLSKDSKECQEELSHFFTHSILPDITVYWESMLIEDGPVWKKPK